MSEFDEAGALAAYWRFFETFNTRDAYSYSTAMNYPHVRISWRSEPTVLADLEAHALSLSWEPFIEMGWDHTVGKEPELLAISKTRAHVAGGWMRYDKNDEQLFGNQVCYIVTRVENQWGIQCRFGSDSGQESVKESLEIEKQAHQVASSFLVESCKGDQNNLWDYANDEIFIINPGEVTRHKRGALMAVPSIVDFKLETIHRGLHSTTINASNVESSALIYLTQNENTWKIKAGSWL